VKCKNCQNPADKALMWAEHRAYVPSCDACVEKLIKKNPQCWDPADNNRPEAIKPIEYILKRREKTKERKKMRKLAMPLLSFMDEMEKIATLNPAGKALAALGGGVTLLKGGLKEWDARHEESTKLKNAPAERQESMKRQVSANRNHRLKRLAVNTALSAGTGAVAGHFGQKAVGDLSQHAASKAKEGIRGAGWTALDPRPALKKIFNRAAKK
jgi:hypothetical protein